MANSLAQTNIRQIQPVQEPARIGFAGIKKITRLPPEPVYNMEVEHMHNFSVHGGLIVHNCIDALRYSLDSEITLRRATTRSDIL